MAVSLEDKEKWTKDGRKWHFTAYYTNIRGQKKPYESKLFFTKKEAIEAERMFLSIHSTKTVVKKNPSFIEVYDEWLLYKKQLIKSTSYYRIIKMMNKHVRAYFEEHKLHDIKLNTLNTWKTDLNSKGLSLEYQNTIIGYIVEILKYAVDNYDYDKKVINNFKKYRIEYINDSNDAEWNFWTYEEFKQFIKVVDDSLYFIIFNFLYFTGVRKGEMIALNWYKYFPERKEIKINENFSDKVEGSKYVIVDPKTKNSIRIIGIDDYLSNLLDEHYEREKQLYGFNKSMFMFGNVKHIAPTTLARKLNYYIEKAGVKRITPHGFRHSHVSLLINLGCDSREVADRIGDTVQVVEKTYYHMFPQKRKNTVLVLNNLKNIG